MSRLFSHHVRSKSHLLAVTAACFLFVGNAQCQEKECCNIISIDGESSIVYARHTETGRILQFPVDELDIRSVRIGDRVGATFTGDTAVVTSIAGADRNYATIIRLGRDIFDVGGYLKPPGVQPGRDILDVGSSEIRIIDVGADSSDWIIINPGNEFLDVRSCCPIAANPELSGISGRVVVDAPLEGSF